MHDKVKCFKMKEIFRTVLHNEKYHILVGNQKVSINEFDTQEEAENYIDSKPWELIGNLSMLICKHQMEEYKKERANNIINYKNRKK